MDHVQKTQTLKKKHQYEHIVNTIPYPQGIK